jgi:hypothetical protein
LCFLLIAPVEGKKVTPKEKMEFSTSASNNLDILTPEQLAALNSAKVNRPTLYAAVKFVNVMYVR